MRKMGKMVLTLLKRRRICPNPADPPARCSRPRSVAWWERLRAVRTIGLVWSCTWGAAASQCTSGCRGAVSVRVKTGRKKGRQGRKHACHVALHPSTRSQNSSIKAADSTTNKRQKRTRTYNPHSTPTHMDGPAGASRGLRRRQICGEGPVSGRKGGRNRLQRAGNRFMRGEVPHLIPASLTILPVVRLEQRSQVAWRAVLSIRRAIRGW
jgi:hypothetical protein